MLKHFRRLVPCVVFFAAALLPFARAADAFYSIRAEALTLLDSKWPEDPKLDSWWRTQLRWQAFFPYAVLDGPGEIYVDFSDPSYEVMTNAPGTATVAIRAPAGAALSGTMFVPRRDLTGMVALKFKAENPTPVKDAHAAFFKAKAAHFEELVTRGMPGTAWFRHELDEANAALGKLPGADPNALPRRPRGDGLQDAYELFSGGRAISENLQLDRAMRLPKPGEATIELASIEGLTVKEMDWTALNKDAAPETDALAAAIPIDQHAIFFPSFQAMLDMADEADASGTPLLRLYESQSEDAGSRARYQRQLCLDTSEVSRLFGPSVVSSLAVTGADPYLRTGADVAVIFAAKSEAVLRTFLVSKQAAALKKEPLAAAVKGEIDGLPYVGVTAPNCVVSSYLASQGNTLIVSNSLEQLGRVLATLKGKTPSLRSAPEYKFFRTRYALGAKDESALLVLSDATIRRWCGPRWRIGSARRTQALAALAELQSRCLDELARGEVQERVIESPFDGLGVVTLTAAGVSSSIYGTLDYQTPISELALSKVSESEKQEYETWRNGYQANWRAYFDPIAVRFGVTPAHLSADLTVMPLISATDYREFRSIALGEKIPAEATDRHAEAFLHWTLALNTKGESFKHWMPEEENSPARWLGNSISFYLDDDPVWEEWAQSKDPEKMLLRDTLSRLPMAINAQIKDVELLKKTITKLEREARGDELKLQKLDYNGQSYFKMPKEYAIGVALFVAITSDSLIVTPNEATLKRALERHAAARKEEPAAVTPANAPWLGEHMGLHLTVPQFERLVPRVEYLSALQTSAWTNLPILNEWKRRFPKEDPVALHEKLWGVKLVCPGGGQYVWNEKWQTMESTVFGNPAEPKAPAKLLPPALERLQFANFGLTFENDGLRARVQLERSAK